MVNLTVYKASAGSGKTFTLATEYIKLLIENPLAYRNILAVTFTNKATEEMKQRILWQLYGISKQLPSSESYIKNVCESLDISREKASEQATRALHELVHNYSYFRVGTIDAFFQNVLRNLARELDLTANLRVELNDKQIMEQAVDEMTAELKPEDKVLKWIISYITENIQDDKSWNVFGQIKNFGKTIFEDTYKEESEILNQKLGEKGFFERYTKNIRTIRQETEERMGMYAKSFFGILEQSGLTAEDLSGKNKGIVSYFRKLQSGKFSYKDCWNKTVEKHLDDAEAWVAKSHPDRYYILGIVEAQLMPLLKNAENERGKQWMLMESANKTLQHLNKLRLLAYIENKVRSMNEDANRFLLSDTQKLLHDLIDDSDSPFIFEKIGTQLEHIMIDEFQDTSVIQWNNFKVLLMEILSHKNSRNLIVGDVKQSIYRWRNGDWRLLNDIEQNFDPGIVKVRSLHTNYRSEKNIIDFNNWFFKKASEIEYANETGINPEEAEQLKRAYYDVEQEVPNDKKENGYVKIELLSDEDYDENMMKSTETAVIRLLQAGVQQKDIAILLRANKNIPVVADYFMRNHPELKLVSDEAFRLDSSLAVNIIIAVLKLVYSHNDLLTLAFINKVCGKEDVDVNSYKTLPLKEMVEKICQDFNIADMKEQSAYVSTFFDQLTKFIDDFGSNLHLFLREWNEHICKKTIQSDETDGIRLLSIHKSKGLEFHSVIIPYCDWKLELSNTLWCKPKEAPFNELPVVPVDYSSKLMETIYSEDYKREHLQNCVDNLNLLYVAFTRACKNLFVIGKSNSSGTRSTIIEQVIGDVEYEVGNDVCAYNNKEEENDVMLIPTRIDSFNVPAEFRQSNKSREFIVGENEDEKNMYIKLGTVLHNIFSNIRTLDDIPKVIQEMEFEGILYNDDISVEHLRKMLSKRLETKQVKEWFSPKWRLFNECTILSVNADGEVIERRPDRVMTDGEKTIVVDFKFGKPHEEYYNQIKSYMQLLRDMGMPCVEGFLWYVYANKIEEVKQ